MKRLETLDLDVFKGYLEKAVTPVAVRGYYRVSGSVTKGDVFFTFFAREKGGDLLVALRVPFGFPNFGSVRVGGEDVPWATAVEEGRKIRGIERVSNFGDEVFCVVSFVFEHIVGRVRDELGEDIGFLRDSEWGCANGGEKRD